MLKLLLTFTLLVGCTELSFSQADTTPVRQTPVYRNVWRPDSAFLARRQAIRDSVRRVQDSLAMVWVKAPDPNRPHQFLDSLIALYKVEDLNFEAWAAKFKKKVIRFDQGDPRPHGETWVIVMILFLVLFFALIRFYFAKQLGSIVRSLFSNQALGQLNKEDTLFNSWPFVFLYLLFGLIIGMYLYLSSKSLQVYYPVEGFNLFILFSALIVGLFTVKIVVLRLLGFLFDISKLVREYVSILYISYFNIALLFLPLIFAFALTPPRYSEIYGVIGVALLALIFIVQFLRAGANILSNHRFPKVYLIIYLCALEFCPLIILFKALRF